MSNDMKPEIRFPGFTEDWEQRKVGEFYDFKNGLNKEKEFFGSGVPIVNFVDVFHNRGLTPEMLKGRVTLSEKEIKNFEVKQGDIFFTRTSETINEIGYPSVMLGAPTDTVFSGFVLRGRARSVDPMNNLFKRYVFFTESFRNEMVKKSSMTTRALTSGTAIKEMYVQYPTSKDEQHKIGAFLAQIDETITLKQRKLDLLKETKKGFLQKMFPKNGAKVPEIRFPGFTEDWEQSKLSELAEVKTGFPFKNDDFIDGGDYLVITNGNIQNNSALVDGNIGNRISAVSDEIKDKYLLNYGDILVTMDGTVGRTAKVFEKNQILAQRVGRLVANTTPEFLYQWLNTGKFFGDMTKVSHGGTIKHISLSEISDFNAFVPVNEDERVKIGSLLLNIDKTITLHQRKLDLLKETKKGFLQKMFV
ncbi:restriction endonuclease subunit S [Enterococcus hirae]